MIETTKSHDLEALRALRAVRYRAPVAPTCVKCGGSGVSSCEEGLDFYCEDCGQMWLAEQTGD